MRWPVACWVFVLTAIAVVQVIRAQAFDAAVFFVASAGVSLDAAILPRFTARHTVPLRRLVGWALVAGLAIALLARHGTFMRVVIVLVGVAAVTAGWAGWAVRSPLAPVALTLGIRRLAVAWAVIMIIGCLWELFQFLMGLAQPHGSWFALSDLLNPIVGTWPGKAAFTAAWLACGVWLLRRGGDRSPR